MERFFTESVMVSRRKIMSGMWVFAIFIAMAENCYGLNIVQGGLPGMQCAVWALISAPVVIYGIRSIVKALKKSKRNITMMGLAGSFVFVLSALKIPAVPECCSHMAGTGMGAIMFGPFVTSVMGIVVLVLQAIFVNRGGFATIGANTFSLGIAGPVAAYLSYGYLTSKKVDKRKAIVAATFIGNMGTCITTAIQLAISNPENMEGFGMAFGTYMAHFLPTQVPLAFAEGVLTVLVLDGINKFERNALNSVGFYMEYQDDMEKSENGDKTD